MEDVYDQQRRELTKEYNQQLDKYHIYKLIFNCLFWGLFLFFSIGTRLYQGFIKQVPYLDLQLILFIIVVYAIYSALDWTLNYFCFYKLNKSYGLTNQSSQEWLVDNLKMGLLSILFLYLAGRAFLTFSSYYADLWWVAFAGAGSLFTIILNFSFPVVIFPIFFELTPYPETSLRERLMNLFDTAGVEVADIYEFDLSSKTNSANAAVMGMGQTRKIILGDNLTDRYSNEEIEAVLAHEIGHHAHNDMFKLLFLQLGSLLFATFMLAIVWEPIANYFSYSDPYSIVALPLLMIGLGFLNWIISPVELFLQRKTEKAADDFALDLIEKPDKLGRALSKLADEALVNLDLSTYKLLFKASHPPIANRIEKSLEWDENKGVEK